MTPEDVGSLLVALPSFHMQRAIADYLDAETARIDALIEKKRRMVELLEERFRIEQTRLLTGDSHAERIRHSLFGSLPSHWVAMRAKFCTARITVGVVVNPSSYFVEEGDAFIHGSDVREGWIDETSLKYLSAESNLLLRKSRLRAGDVLAMRVGYPGRASVVPASLDGSNCASVLIFRQSPILLPNIIAEFLNSPVGRTQIASVQYGAAQEVMNVSDAVNLVLPVAPVAEQVVIDRALENSRDRWLQTVASIQQHIHLLAEHRQALITAAVTGQLDIPGAAA